MDRVLADTEFRRSERNVSLLRFLVTETLAGRAADLSAHRIGVEVFGRDASFEPNQDPILRNQASRLRRALERYYFVAGTNDPIRIGLPRGNYVPTFNQSPGFPDIRKDNFADNSLELPKGPSIAVLPFIDLSEQPDHEFFADGLVEELVVELSRFQDFFVIGRHSTLKYAGQDTDLREIGRELGVAYILTGSTITSADRLRISVKLTDTGSGHLLWADRFNADLAASDILDTQDRIVSEVVSRVADSYGVISRNLSQASARMRPNELSSYEAVLRYHHYHSGVETEVYEGWRETREGLERAVERDPEYVLAWAKLAESLCAGFVFGYSDEPDLLDRAVTSARRAIGLDPNSQDAHIGLMYCQFAKQDREKVLSAARRAIELNPNSAYPIGAAGVFMALAGEWEEGLALIEKARRLNPYNPGWLLLPRYAEHIRTGEHEEALDVARRIDNPDTDLRLLTEAAALGHLGRAEEGARAIAALKDLRSGISQGLDSFAHNIMFDEEIGATVVDGLVKAGFTPEANETVDP